MRRPSPPGAGKPGREVRASCRKGLTRVHVLPGHSPGAGLLLDGVAETRQDLADFAARHAEPLLDRALGALEGTLPFHFLVAREDPDGLLHLPLDLLRFSADFLLSHGVLLSVLSVRERCARGMPNGALSRSSCAGRCARRRRRPSPPGPRLPLPPML